MAKEEIARAEHLAKDLDKRKESMTSRNTWGLGG
jgi:hypothetical protein